MPLALGALAGVLSGLGGLPKGMAEGTAADQRQQQLDEQARHAQSSEDLQRQTLALHQTTADAPLRLDAVRNARAVQERKGSADAFRKAAVSTNNPNLATLADLIESGGIKDPGNIYETELKGQQATGERAGWIEGLRGLLGPGFNMPDVPARGAPPQAAVPPDVAAAQRSVATTGQGATQKIDTYNATPGAVPIAPPGGGAGGGPTPMPNAPSAFRPDLSIKAGPMTINLKTPTDERDSYASSMFNGLLFHQLRPEQQAAVLQALPTSPKNRLDQSSAQGREAAQIQLDKAKETVLPPEQASKLNVPYGTTQSGAYGKTPITTAQENKAGAAKSALAIIDGVEKELSGIKLPSGPGSRLMQTPQNLWGVYGQGDPKMAALKARIDGTLSTVIRALGEVGTLSDKDIARAQSLWPKFVPVPDSKEVVAEKMRGLRELVQEVGGRGSQAPAVTPGPPQSGIDSREGTISKSGKFIWQGGQWQPR